MHGCQLFDVYLSLALFATQSETNFSCDAISLVLRTELRVTVDLLILSMSLCYSPDEYRYKLASFPGFCLVFVACMDYATRAGEE